MTMAFLLPNVKVLLGGARADEAEPKRKVAEDLIVSLANYADNGGHSNFPDCILIQEEKPTNCRGRHEKKNNSSSNQKELRRKYRRIGESIDDRIETSRLVESLETADTPISMDTPAEIDVEENTVLKRTGTDEHSSIGRCSNMYPVSSVITILDIGSTDKTEGMAVVSNPHKTSDKDAPICSSVQGNCHRNMNHSISDTVHYSATIKKRHQGQVNPRWCEGISSGPLKRPRTVFIRRPTLPAPRSSIPLPHPMSNVSPPTITPLNICCKMNLTRLPNLKNSTSLLQPTTSTTGSQSSRLVINLDNDGRRVLKAVRPQVTVTKSCATITRHERSPANTDLTSTPTPDRSNDNRGIDHLCAMRSSASSQPASGSGGPLNHNISAAWKPEEQVTGISERKQAREKNCRSNFSSKQAEDLIVHHANNADNEGHPNFHDCIPIDVGSQKKYERRHEKRNNSSRHENEFRRKYPQNGELFIDDRNETCWLENPPERLDTIRSKDTPAQFDVEENAVLERTRTRQKSSSGSDFTMYPVSSVTTVLDNGSTDNPEGKAVDCNTRLTSDKEAPTCHKKVNYSKIDVEHYSVTTTKRFQGQVKPRWCEGISSGPLKRPRIVFIRRPTLPAPRSTSPCHIKCPTCLTRR